MFVIKFFFVTQRHSITKDINMAVRYIFKGHRIVPIECNRIGESYVGLVPSTSVKYLNNYHKISGPRLLRISICT